MASVEIRNFERFTNGELVDLLAAAKQALVAGDGEQTDAWNRLFDKAAKEVEKRLNSD